MENHDVTTVTMPSEQTDAAAVPESDGLQDTAFRLPVKFNKQDYQLNLEEATVLAQKGMKLDSVQPMLDKLKGLAEQHGLGVREFVDALCEPDDTPSSDARGAEQRMAEEYRQLREHCPDVAAFDALPESVIRTALNEGVALLDAYLRYEYAERRRITDAAQAAAAACARSAGAQYSPLESAPDPAIEAMIAGVSGA